MDQNNKPNNPLVYPNKELADDFAQTAMLGLISSGMYAPSTEHHFEKLAEHSYRIAEAMLKAREKINL